MADLHHSSEMAFLHELADAAGAAILPHFRTDAAVENKREKDRYDPVTVADRLAETAMRDLISSRHPADGICGEEFGAERLEADRVWVLDPIDGTRAFVAGLPVWGVLIGLLAAGRPALGLMSQPFTGERFFGDGATAEWARGDSRRRLACRPCASLGDAVLFTTSPHLFSEDERRAYEGVEARVRFARYGCDCYAYCMVAAGHADLVVEAGLAPYDIVALVPVIEGAGGAVTTWTGGPPAAGGRIVASGDKRLHDAVLRLLA